MSEIYKNRDLNDLPGEEWRGVPDWENYMVSNLGRVKVLSHYYLSANQNGVCTKKKKEKILLQGDLADNGGYVSVTLIENKSRKKINTHRLVAISFIDNIENKPCVNHINGIKHDNRFENLEWCTYSENEKHAYSAGLKKISGVADGRNREKVLQFDLNGNFIKMWDWAGLIEKELNIFQSNVGSCCIGRLKSAGGYKWLFKDKDKSWQRPNIV